MILLPEKNNKLEVIIRHTRSYLSQLDVFTSLFHLADCYDRAPFFMELNDDGYTTISSIVAKFPLIVFVG